MIIGELIRLLSDGKFHSGEQLGDSLGVSRTAVWKQLKKLEAMNIPLEAVKGLGYRLPEPLELLSGPTIVAGIERESRQHLARLFIEQTLSSTNLFVRERFLKGAGHAEVCLAENQSAGRGRRGRGWACPWGHGLLLSIGWRFETGTAALEGLSLAVGVAMAEVLERHGLPVVLKWPNDILVSDSLGKNQKLAGILLEVSGDAAGPCEVVAGLGLNVSLPASVRSQIDQPVASVHDYQPTLSRNRLASELVAALLGLFASFEGQGFAPWRDAWNRRNAHAGRAVLVTQGARQYTAKVTEADAAGNLLIETSDGPDRLTGGEISLRGQP